MAQGYDSLLEGALFFFFKIDRGREKRGRKRERNSCGRLSWNLQARALCLDWESNPQTFALWYNGQPTEPHQPGLKGHLESDWSRPGRAAQLERQDFRFDPQSGHIQEATQECTNKWNNKSMFLSFSLFRPFSF